MCSTATTSRSNGPPPRLRVSRRDSDMDASGTTAKAMDRAIDVAIKGNSPYPEHAAFIDAESPHARSDLERIDVLKPRVQERLDTFVVIFPKHDRLTRCLYPAHVARSWILRDWARSGGVWAAESGRCPNEVHAAASASASVSGLTATCSGTVTLMTWSRSSSH